ncbi:MAG: transcriptional regulator GlxA family with amidase domain [Gammaproteobacteria bacterium]|jgi:transcriptional regulator GlxA family with amidase domain
MPGDTAVTVKTEKIGILLIEGYPLIPFSCVVESLRTANRLSGTALFEWLYFSPDSTPVVSSSGITLPTIPLSEATDLETLVICAPNTAQHFDDSNVFRLLKKFDKQGVNLGSISSGSFLLARASLLDNCRCTIHWENIPVFKELYPHLEVTFTLYEINNKRFTCSGGTAALDMMLKLIEIQHGRVLAQEISQQFQHDRIRTDIDSQQMADRIDLAMSAPKLIDVISLMESNIETPLSLPAIAEQCNVSLRQIERLFHKYRGVTPSQYYLSLRLLHAKQLLLNTNRSVIDISIATGFETQSYFTACYRKYFGSSPRSHRSQVATERQG